MRIQSLKAVPEPQAPAAAAHASAGGAAHPHGGADAGGIAAGMDHDEAAGPVVERQALEIALLKARLQHVELVLETARSLMGSNQERLLRRLHEAPRDIASLSAQLRRVDPQASW